MLFLTVVKPREIARMKISFHNYEMRIPSQNSLWKFVYSVLINLCKISLLLDTGNFYTHTRTRTLDQVIMISREPRIIPVFKIVVYSRGMVDLQKHD